MKAVRSWTKLIVLLIVGSLLSGCRTTVPNVKPFADKTAEMSSVLAKGFTRTENTLIEASGKPKSEEVKKLQAAWEPTRKALAAVVDYSDSLAALADAGAKGGEAAQAVADSLNGLLSNVAPVVGIPGAVPENLVKIFKEVYAEVARRRAAKNLRLAVHEAQPAIDIVARVLAANFRNLAQIDRAAQMDVRAQMELEQITLDRYHGSLANEKDRVTTNLTLILDYQASQTADEKRDNLTALRKGDTVLDERLRALGNDFDRRREEVIETRKGELLKQVLAVQAELDRIKPDYDAFAARRNSILGRMKDDALAFERSQQAIDAWAEAHKKLEAAIDKKQRVAINELATAVQQIADIFKEGDK